MTSDNDSARYLQLGEELLQLETRKKSLAKELSKNDGAPPSKVHELDKLQSRINRIMNVMQAFHTL